MHLPSCNAETRPSILHAFIQQNPLGILTTAIESDTYPFLQSSHIPWLIDSDSSGLGRLRGHIARQNPQSKAIIESCTAQKSQVLERDVSVMFTEPVHHYVTPHFYKQTKPETGKVVPTWDYSAVEVRGRARVYVDTRSAESGAFLAAQIRDLSRHMEGEMMGYGKGTATRAWEVDDAPEKYVELLTKNIIGIEVEITAIEGRFKWSQEKPAKDREGVAEGFRSMGKLEGQVLAEKVEERARLFDAEKEARKSERAENPIEVPST